MAQPFLGMQKSEVEFLGLLVVVSALLGVVFVDWTNWRLIWQGSVGYLIQSTCVSMMLFGVGKIIDVCTL